MPVSTKEYASLGNKIGIFGGTFDPVQSAHLLVANRALEAFGLDCVLFIPAKQNPLKKHSPIASDTDRLHMLELALEKYPKFKISTLELDSKQENPSFTIDTLQSLQRLLHKESKLYLILGTDNLSNLHKWKNIESILELIELPIFMTRELNMFQKFIDNIPPELEKYQEKFRSGRVQFDPIPYSSSQIRREISEATFVDKDSLPTEVWNYITQTKLYN